ncbi:NAD(P)-binding protein [Solitalea sp. MAHUQ-68]|uniref:NAD(P)-binding protein n=1 Tax=Solitalea agri TaxID=2953739 RepID=A0A9X2JEB2_9SPHI|nr:NAD(P)/FAD-dependent oxidoreductase [Solitalea agri]MCO4292196.1 NAD(P)-binding protein [Solitalea agri]
MSGQNTYNQSANLLSRLNRKAFLLRAGIGLTAAIAGGYLFNRKRSAKTAHIKGSIIGANAKIGHLLRDKLSIPEPSTTEEIEYLIIGGGISGLAAARELKRQGISSFKLIELDNHTGGNSSKGKNEISAYPWGAHYLPIPDPSDSSIISFLTEIGCITGFSPEGLPIYNEYHLCFDPEERLYIRGQWQEGLIPNLGLSLEERTEIERFFKLMEYYKTAKGIDGKYAFAIPLKDSSSDPTFINLDKISFITFLEKEKFRSKHLLWYLNYACKDDFGSTLNETSAWAGIHYFASRKGKAANAKNGDLLTWPEGNAWLAEQLRSQVADHISVNSVAFNVSVNNDSVLTSVYNTVDHKSKIIKARKVLLATPQFVNQRLLHEVNSDRSTSVYEQFSYAPWMIANITIHQLPVSKGIGLCWDNVMFESDSVGYVNACHQHVNQNENKKILTYYLPLTGKEPKIQRLVAFTRSYNDWVDIVCKDLENSHPGITEFIETVDIWIWGHGMVRPNPGFIWGEAKRMASQPINDKVFFAHTDLSGISIFEEAFHQGIAAAKSMTSTETHNGNS